MIKAELLGEEDVTVQVMGDYDDVVEELSAIMAQFIVIDKVQKKGIMKKAKLLAELKVVLLTDEELKHASNFEQEKFKDLDDTEIRDILGLKERK